MSQTMHDSELESNDVIERVVKQEIAVGPGDRVAAAGFDDDTGRATAVLMCETCLDSGAVETIRQSETFKLAHVHPGLDGVNVHLIENMED